MAPEENGLGAKIACAAPLWGRPGSPPVNLSAVSTALGSTSWPDFIRLWSADLNRLAMCDVVQQLANLSGLFSLRNVR